MTEFENTKTKIEAYMDDFIGALEDVLKLDEIKEKLLPDFKRAITCNVSEWAQPEQICGQKASMETILNTGISAVEDTIKKGGLEMLQYADRLVTMENSKSEIIDGYDDLMEISFARQSKTEGSNNRDTFSL